MCQAQDEENMVEGEEESEVSEVSLETSENELIEET